MDISPDRLKTQDAPSAEVELIVEWVVQRCALDPGDAADKAGAYRDLAVRALQLDGLPVPSDAWLDEFIREMVEWHRDDDADAETAS
jgi:hypothetical protein